MRKLRPWVFWPPLLLIFAALLSATLAPQLFIGTLNTVNGWLLDKLSPVFAYGSLFVLFTCVAAYVSPLGRVTLGGENATRMLTPGSWCAISLCTVTAVGILFWAMAEPITHLSAPPVSLNLAPGSPEAARFALSTVFMHWTFIPCALYALPALVFGLSFYNLKLPFSLSSPLVVIMGRAWANRVASLVDGVALYALVAGMAASLATGVLTLAGGLEHLYGIPSSNACWVAIGIAIVVAFVASALSGIHKGITFLSRVNSAFFVFLAVYIIAFGPFRDAAALSLAGVKEFGSHFFSRALFLEFGSNDPWPRTWTVFYWCVWVAWAPITAAFLGRIAVGYTVRAFLLVNLALPAFFSLFWMAIFGGSALALEANGANLVGLLATKGPEGLVYAVFAKLPFSWLVIPVFLTCAFISYVTAADSNTLAMAGMSEHGISPESPEPQTWVKLVWGCTVGALALCLLCLSGIDGIRTLSYLGGVPALFYVLAVSFSLLKLCWRPEKFGLKIPKWNPPSEKLVSPAELPQGSLP